MIFNFISPFGFEGNRNLKNNSPPSGDSDFYIWFVSYRRGHIFIAEVLRTLSGTFLPAKYAKPIHLDARVLFIL